MSGSGARSARLRGEDAAIHEAYTTVADELESALRATVADRSPDPARAAVARLTSIDDDMPEDEPPPGWSLAFLVLADWFDAARDALADRPDRADRALAWIEECLGKRYRLRAAYTIAPLVGLEDAGEASHYIDALGDDFLASMVWGLAAVTDLYGDGAGWLRGRAESTA